MPEETVPSQTDPLRRPLLGIAFCYLAGILSGVWIDGLHFITILLFAFFALVIAFVLHYLSRSLPSRPDIIQSYREAPFIFRFLPGLTVCLVYLVVFLAGWLAINLRLNNPSARNLSVAMERPREGMEIIGVIADDPALRQNWRGDGRYWSFAMKVKAVCRTGAFQQARGEILVRMPTNAVPHYGECWKLCGALLDRARFVNDSGMESLKSQLPYRFAFQVSGPAVPVLIAGPAPYDLIHWCFVLRQKCADILARGITHRPEVTGILQALLLGRRYELPAALREAFVATGTYHIFAISGHHVAIIAIFVMVVLQVSGVCRLHWFYYLAPALIVFTIMAGMSASAMRGCIMALMCFLGPVFKRKTDLPSAMALAALLIVGVDPRQLFQAGFILSFGIVAGLIVLCPPLIAMVERRVAADPYQLEPENWPARSMRTALRWILFMMAASFAAWLVSMPLAARWFNLVSLIALPANLIVIPMATIILLTGALSIIAGLFCPFIAEVFNFANVAFVSLTTGVTKALAQVPFGHIFVKSPPVWFVCLWLGVLIVWRIYHANSVTYYQKTKIWLAAVLVLLIAGGLMWRAQRNEWEIHAFNIDQSAVCLVNQAGRSPPLLFNAGPMYQAYRVLQYLRKTGVNRIQALACPFPDAKHIGAATNIIAALPVDKIWLGPKKSGTAFIRELRAAAEKKRVRVEELTNGVWYLRLDRNGRQIDIFSGSNGTAQARILIGDEQTPLVIDIEEAPVSGAGDNTEFNMPAGAHCRVLCCPTVMERTRNYGGQSFDLQLPARIELGPGQGVLLLPGKGKEKMRAINLNLSGNSR